LLNCIPIGHKWATEAAERSPDAAAILVGLYKDLPEDPIAIEEMQKKSEHFVNSKEVSKIAHHIGAKKYLEYLSLTGQGVVDVF
jgi:Rho family protein